MKQQFTEIFNIKHVNRLLKARLKPLLYERPASMQNPTCILGTLPQRTPSLPPKPHSPLHHIPAHNAGKSARFTREQACIQNSRYIPCCTWSHLPPERWQRHPAGSEETLARVTAGQSCQKIREGTETK